MIQFSQHTLLNILHMHGSQYQVECHNWHTNPVTEGAGGYSVWDHISQQLLSVRIFCYYLLCEQLQKAILFSHSFHQKIKSFLCKTKNFQVGKFDESTTENSYNEKSYNVTPEYVTLLCEFIE